MKRLVVTGLLINLAILLIGVTWIGPIGARDQDPTVSSLRAPPASTAPASAIASASATSAGLVTVSIQQWSITPQVSTVSTGPITFEVSDKGTITHEFVVMRTNTPAAHMKVGTYEGQSPRVNENTAGTVVGETGDMAAGTSKFVTINLEPGHYVFMCNLPAHYGLGMHTNFIVTGP